MWEKPTGVLVSPMQATSKSLTDTVNNADNTVKITDNKRFLLFLFIINSFRLRAYPEHIINSSIIQETNAHATAFT